MITIYERPLLHSFASAVREGIVIATVETEERAKDLIWRLTSGTYSCFAVLEDGTVIDEFGSYPKLLEVGE